jgi:uncharacterized protein (DUF58 family)
MRGIRPTRRGVVLAAAAVVAVGMGVGFGPRSLDAVVVPVVVALVAAVVQVLTLSPPRVERTTPPPGVPGTTGTVTLALATDTPVTAVVDDRLPTGLSGESRRTALVGDGATPVGYEVTYRERGDHAVGPATVRTRDVLGLAERRFVVSGESSVLVYPQVYRPSAPLADRLRSLSSPDDSVERGAFDHLREYDRGDSLRDVHWKSSAKRDDLVVQEFVDEGERRTVTVAVTAANGHADRMAEAAATVGVALLAEGVGVSLATPTGRVAAEPGEADRLLSHLARAGPGSVAVRDADVRIEAARDGTAIRIGGESLAFDPGRPRRVDDAAATGSPSTADPSAARGVAP